MPEYLDETGLAHFWGNIKPMIDANTEKINELMNLGKPVATNTQKHVYVDVENGSDENNGMSSSAPFKTLDRVFEYMASLGENSYRIYFLSSGTYPVTKGKNLAYCTIHFVPSTYDVTISFETTEFSVYYSHWNISADASHRFKLVNNTQQSNVWFDDCVLECVNVDFDSYFTIYKSSLRGYSTGFKNKFRASNSYMFMTGGCIITPQTSANMFDFQNCIVLFSGANTIKDTLETDFTTQPSVNNSESYFINAEGGIIVINSQIIPSALTNKYWRFFAGNSTIFNMTNTRINNSKNAGVNDMTMTYTAGCIHINSASVVELS